MSDHKSEQHAPDTASTEVNEQPLQSMEEELADLKTKLAEMQDNFLRAKAEAENIRRRAAEDIAKAHKFAIENFAEHLIPVSDSLYAALATEAGDAKAFKEGLEITLKQLRGVKFDWKESGLPSYGVIAQELEEVLPELVHGNDPKTVNYNGIIGVLIEAIKELKAEVEELKNNK